jgi:hypothetical protein
VRVLKETERPAGGPAAHDGAEVAEGEEYGVEYSARAALEASVQAFCDRQVEPVEGKTGDILMKSKTVTEASAKNNLESASGSSSSTLLPFPSKECSAR